MGRRPIGNDFEPVKGSELPGRLAMPSGVDVARLQRSAGTAPPIRSSGPQLDAHAAVEPLDRYTQMAYDMVTSGKVRKAFDISQEPAAVRDAYGRDSIGEKALLARRLVEAGVTFVLVSGAWGYFDHHGDEVRWGGIEKGLTAAAAARGSRDVHAGQRSGIAGCWIRPWF